MASKHRVFAARAKELVEGDPAQHLACFEHQILPHAVAARKLAGWLMCGHSDAEDVVQEALLRALKSFDTFNGRDGRKWLLAIVRNCCHNYLRRERLTPCTGDVRSLLCSTMSTVAEPLSVLVRTEETQLIHASLAELPVEYQEVVVLRELDGVSYRQIAKSLRIPVGTVMSRLARGRQRLRRLLMQQKRAFNN